MEIEPITTSKVTTYGRLYIGKRVFLPIHEQPMIDNGGIRYVVTTKANNKYFHCPLDYDGDYYDWAIELTNQLKEKYPNLGVRHEGSLVFVSNLYQPPFEVFISHSMPYYIVRKIKEVSIEEKENDENKND